MAWRHRTQDAQPSLDNHLAAIQTALAALPRRPGRYPTIDRLLSDLAAARFHLRRPDRMPPLLAILGGTGTGKSTLLNRLLGADLTATSFRRTFTAGPVAVTSDPQNIPDAWLGIDHAVIPPAQVPARGQPDVLSIVTHDVPVTRALTLVDTPDLDGDQPAHHAQADRVFRWADAVLFLVTPEKYQMTELLPFYRLAQRYELNWLGVMNKAEEQAVVDDYRQQLSAQAISPSIFVIPRDDAAFEPPGETGLAALRQALVAIRLGDRAQGNALRAMDLMDRLRDQAIEPMRCDRREIDRLIHSLRAMETPPPGLDVNPLTQQLQRRLQQRSILYLMGPGRILDRVRQVPGLLARLPRTTWDLLRRGRLSANGDADASPDLSGQKPDFAAAMVDQFTIVQSRIDDLLRSDPASLRWIEQADSDYPQSKLDPVLAARIADDEIARLQQWLEKQWNATPRDTAIIEKLLRLLPGGKQLAKWSEAAPYILAIVVATHHAFFGHIDLLILGGWSLATWLSEKLSNQVSARARAANQAIASRFSELAHRQIEQTCQWLDHQAPQTSQLEKITAMADDVSESIETQPSFGGKSP